MVINCSGLVRGFNMKDQKGVINSNFQNTVNIVNSCINLNVDRFINTGSAYECGFSNRAISAINCGDRPIGLYGVTKRAESAYIDFINKKYSRNFTTLRLFTPYGYYDSPLRLVPYMFLSLINGLTPIIKTPDSIRDFIFVEEVAKFYYRIAENPELLGKATTVNVGTGIPTKVSEVSSIITNMFGKTYRVENFERNEPISLFSRGEFYLPLLGRAPNRKSLISRLKKTKEWFEKNKGYYENFNFKRSENTGSNFFN